MPLSSEFIKAAGLMSSMKKMTEAVKKELPNLVAFGSNVDNLEKMEDDLEKSAKALSAAIQAYTKDFDKFEGFVKAIESSHSDYEKAVKDWIKDGRNHGEKEYKTACEAMEQGLERIEKKVATMKKYWAPPPKW